MNTPPFNLTAQSLINEAHADYQYIVIESEADRTLYAPKLATDECINTQDTEWYVANPNFGFSPGCVYRRKRPVTRPVWIRSRDRRPSESDLPFMTKADTGAIGVWTKATGMPLEHSGTRPYLWTPFIEPAMPVPTQAELDEEWVKTNITGCMAESHRAAALAGIRYARAAKV